MLVFASVDPMRFTRELASDFLAHLGVVAAICIENAVNRARLMRSGFTDFLTGFHNRRYLHARLREELARAQRAHQSLACLMIDVDHFKRINDQYGHLAGDAVLREVARRMDAEMRISDTGARFGGDEFAIVLSQALDADGEKVAARVLQRGAQPADRDRQECHRDRHAVDRRRGGQPGEPGARLQGAGRAADRGSGRRAVPRQERRPQPQSPTSSPAIRWCDVSVAPRAAARGTRRTDQGHDRPDRQLPGRRDGARHQIRRREHMPPVSAAAGATMRWSLVRKPGAPRAG